jgi:hypothetical protein
MRTLALSLLLACADAPLPPASPLRLPPAQAMSLSLSPLVAGGRATVVVTGAAPGARVELYRADALRSACFTLPSGACALIAGGPTRVGTLTADASGRALARFTLRLPGDRLVLQAFSGAASSNAAFGWIHPAGTPLAPDRDLDGDGFTLGEGDCHDADPAIFPGALDAPDDGADRSCDGLDSMDLDGDGYEAVAAGGEDCDDADPAVAPAFADPIGDGVDNNCDGVDGMDRDGDGWAAPVDCDDTTVTVAPGLADPLGDRVDSNCDGVDGVDRDGDGYVFPQDCDDTTDTVAPGLADPLGDGVDNNCDGVDGMDRDLDGQPAPLDCNDRDPGIAPGRPDVPRDGVDADCDGADGTFSAGRPDFDGDGFADLPIGAIGDQVGGVAGGRVFTLRGGFSGVRFDGLQTWSRGVAPLPGPNSAGGGFGGELAAGDFNGDGYDDLATATSGPWDAAVSSTADILVLRGGVAGLSFSQALPNLETQREASALITGDFNGDGYDDLVHANPGPGMSTWVYAGGPTGLTAWRSLFHGDGAGAALAVGDFNGDGVDDLVLGQPDLPGADRGRVLFHPGAAGGFDSAPALTLDQDSPDVLGVGEDGDRWGIALSAGDVDGDGFDDLVVGVPFEDLNGVVDAGWVSVLRGGPAGPSAAGMVGFGFDLPALPHLMIASEHFGHAVVACDVDGDGRAEVAASAPGWWTDQLYRGADGGGRVLLFPAAGALLDLTAPVVIDHPAAGLPNYTGQRLGEHLGCADLNADGYGDLLVGSPMAHTALNVHTGELLVYLGGPAGIDPTSPILLTEELLGIGGVAMARDRFGYVATPVR